eukprot:COSAG02_NODE_6037_length_3854_cov_2.682823_5_plen_107_part_01
MHAAAARGTELEEVCGFGVGARGHSADRRGRASLTEMAPPSKNRKPAFAGQDETPQLGWRQNPNTSDADPNRQGSWPEDDSVFAAKLPFGDPQDPEVVALREHMAAN